MKRFSVYQLPIQNKAKYMGYDFVNENNIMPKLNDYKMVYEGEIRDEADLDDVYMYLQGSKPEGYKGHSLSTSDIVFMDGDYFYCDDFGWVKVHFVKVTPKTYKVTFFSKELEIENVITYHNIMDQGAMLDTIAMNIYTLELAEVVKCEADGESYTQAVNELLKGRLATLAA